MGLYKLALSCCIIGATLVACAPQGRPSVAVPTPRPSTASVQPVVTDPKVVEKVAASLSSLDAQAFRAVSMAEVGGTVLLTGAVVRPDQRRQVEQRVAAVPGVTTLSNRIQVTDAASLESYRPDQTKEKVLGGRLAPGLAVRVIKGVVYLVGIAAVEDVDRVKETVAADPTLQWVDASAVSVR